MLVYHIHLRETVHPVISARLLSDLENEKANVMYL